MSTVTTAYPVDLERDESGCFVARVPDLPGCISDGADREQALTNVADALEEALADTITRGENLPAPSPARGRPTVAPGITLTAKLALYRAMRESGTTNVALGAALGLAESEIRRMLSPRYNTKITRLEQALHHFGISLGLTVTTGKTPRVPSPPHHPGL